MKSRDNSIEKLLERHIPSPSQVEMEEDGARVLQRLCDLPAISNGREERTRRVISKRSLVAIAASVVLVALLLLFVNLLLAPNKAYAIVEVVQGAVYQVTEGKAEAVSAGQKIQASTPLRTASGAVAVLKLSDGARIEMHGDSELSLERADHGTNIRLNDGSIRVTPTQDPVGNLYVKTVEHMVPVVSALVVSSQNAQFEVASVRRVEIPPTDRGGVPVFAPTGGVGTSDPSRITYHGTWLASLIVEAFGVRADQIKGPDWMKSERYDIVATIPKGATKEDFKLMLGNLLRDRFHLRFHMDSKILPVYVLGVVKDGIKFKETALTPRGDDATTTSRVTGARDAQGFPVLPPDYQGSLALPVDGAIFIVGQGVPISTLIGWIENPRVDRPVIDETGLAGRYDYRVHMEWRRRPDSGDTPSGAPTIFTALEEQLGLKLESASRPITQLIIDSIDREPTEN